MSNLVGELRIQIAELKEINRHHAEAFGRKEQQLDVANYRITQLEAEIAELLKENEHLHTRLREEHKSSTAHMLKAMENGEACLDAELHLGKMAELLVTYTDGFEGMPDSKVRLIAEGHGTDRSSAQRELKRRAILAELENKHEPTRNDLPSRGS